MTIQADIVLRNGPIWCGREEGVVEALAIFRDKVLAAGSDAEIKPLTGPKTRVIVLSNRVGSNSEKSRRWMARYRPPIPVRQACWRSTGMK